MAANGLVMPGARSSEAIILTQFTTNNLGPEWLQLENPLWFTYISHSWWLCAKNNKATALKGLINPMWSYIFKSGDGLLLTHWGRMTHICVSKINIIGSDNGLSPRRRQAIIWTNAGILLIRPLGTNFSEILFRNQTFSFKKMHLKMSSGKWRPSCLGLNVLTWSRPSDTPQHIKQ